ncbi:MAG: PP2C family protein-serine/threonine phosphatase, partial [Ktedonobacterales bacterium]
RSFIQGARLYRVSAHEEEPPLFPRGVRVVAAMATDTGASRTGEENEDSAGILTLSIAYNSYTEPLTLCVVADGLGGHASGQEASRLAIRTLAEHILRTVALPRVAAPIETGEDAASVETALLVSLKAGAEAANKAICARNAASGADMGSTCAAALIFRDTAYFLNVGDSRGYVLEDDGLRRVTTDHSLVEQLIAGGLITPEERYTHPQRNQIFRSLGDDPAIPLDTFTQKLRPGMRLLLCSDGLWEMVRDDDMARILRETVSPQQACDVLIAAANEHGGEDNISAVLIDICA